jgi:hypothetical protein
MVVAPALRTVLSAARATVADPWVMPEVGGTAHVRRHVGDDVFGHDPTTPAQDRGALAVDPHQGKAFRARRGF